MSAPAVLIACPLLAGVVAALSLHSGPIETLASLVVAWIAAAIAFRWRLRLGFAISIAAGSFAAGAAIAGHAEHASSSTSLLRWFHLGGSVARLTGTLRDDAALTANGVTMTIEARDVDGVVVDGAVRVAVAGSLAGTAVCAWRGGRTVAVPVLLREPLDYGDPGVPSDRERLARQGIVLFGSVKSAALVTPIAGGSLISEAAAALRAWVRTATSASVGRWSQKSAGVVTAILIGDRSGLDADDERRLQEAGTYHVIAISGGNIALLTAMLVALGRALRFPPRGTATASIALLAFYGYVAGLAPSVLRATVAGMVYLAARAVDHRGTALNALAVAAAFAGVTAPLTVTDPGFILSFGATVAIVAAASRLAPERPRPRNAGRVRGAVHVAASAARALVAATICAEIALAPVGARLFGRVSFAGLVLNFAAIPLMSIIQVAGLCAVAVAPASAAAAAALGWIAHAGTVGLIRSASLVDVAPWLVLDLPPPATWLIVVWYLGWAAMLFGARRRVRVAGGVTVIVAGILLLKPPLAARAFRVAPPPSGWTRVVALDVGQGDATIVWPAGAAPLLVDTGGVSGSSFDLGRRVTLPAAWAFGVTRLDALVLTHGDPDHIGGAPPIIRALAPAAIWEGVPVPRDEPLRLLREAANRGRIPWLEKRAGQTLALGAASLRVLNPPEPDWERQKVRNDDSIVLDARVGGVSIVLPGDITRSVDASVAAAFEPAPLVILKAPHHGSPGGSSQVLVDSLHPAAVIFSAGKRNPFGHPAPAIVERYRAAGAHVFSTAEDGAVIVDTNGIDVHIWTWSSRRELWLRRRN